MTKKIKKLTDIFPEFDWVLIPKGVVRLHWIPYSNKEYVNVNVDEFYISKYPITNLQYNVYVNERNYRPKSTFALKQLESKPTHPIIDLNWVEAMAFCDWLSQKIDHTITLPTDAQWLRAAQGDDSRKYPWGNTMNTNFCNIEESKIKGTTPVTQYQAIESPFGVVDMVGNACEWCLTDALNGTNILNYHFNEVELEIHQRLFAGSHFNSSSISADITRFGSSPILIPYFTSIRLATSTN